MKCPLPTDTGFSALSNNVDKTKMSDMCGEFNLKLSEVPAYG